MSVNAKNGQTVSVHYTGTLSDGTEFDSSRGRDTPLTFTIGSGQLIKGFDTAVTGMTVGEVKDISLAPTEAYGEVDDTRIQVLPKTGFPEGFPLNIGQRVMGQNEQGGQVVATIKSVSDDGNVTMDMNHPLAGQTLNFSIELLSIDETEDTTTE